MTSPSFPKLNIWGDPALTEKYLRLKSKWGQYRSQERSPSATVQTKEWNYVASKKSKVFHRPDCKFIGEKDKAWQFDRV